MAKLYSINALNKQSTPQIDITAFLAPTAQIIGDVHIKENASIWFGAVLRGDIEPIIIGKNSNIQDNCILHTDRTNACIVEENVTIGHGAILHGCTIGYGSLIGMGATILNGAIIGKNCLIGANALVTENTIIPEASLVLGSPAKIMRSLSPQDIENMHDNTNRYVTAAQIYKQDLKEI